MKSAARDQLPPKACQGFPRQSMAALVRRGLVLVVWLLAGALPAGASGLDLGPGAVEAGQEIYTSSCQPCHGLKYLGFSALMPADAAKQAFGKVPPDLSLIAAARGRGTSGAEFVVRLLTSYNDTPQKNSVVPGIAMPPPIPRDDPKLEEKARRVAAFLYSAAFPEFRDRKTVGSYAVAYTALLTVLLFLLYRSVWKGVSHSLTGRPVPEEGRAPGPPPELPEEGEAGAAPVDRAPSFYEDEEHRGLLSWLFSTDHKRIGILYLIAVSVFFFAGAAIALLMRVKLLSPGDFFVTARTYNQLFTLHGITMIFLFIIPGIPAVLGNFFLPIQVGARDVAFPRLNNLSWWLFMSGGILALSTIFLPGGPPDTGWTLYAPYSIRTSTNVSVAALAVFVIGFSAILTAINFLTTIYTMRAPGMTWFRLPLFIWTLFATAWTQILATPILAIAVALLIFERIFGTGFFDPVKGGDPLLWQHLFWIYSHPAVYIMVLPAMGIVSEIIPVFSRRSIFGYHAIAFSALAIASVGYMVWGHHMFTSGMSHTADWLFSLLTYLVAIPSGIKVFNWIATLYRGSIVLETPLLWVFSFIFLFTLGGLTGLIQGAIAANIPIHDTYFIVAHFHYVMFGGTVFAFIAGLHYWFPKMFGRLYNEKMAKTAWLAAFIGFNLLYFPMFLLGIEGLPRRYYAYLPKYQPLQVLSTVGSWILISAILLMVFNLVRSLFKGAIAGSNPWGGTTLEWQIPSPPPTENFEEIPVITRGPYDYGR